MLGLHVLELKIGMMALGKGQFAASCGYFLDGLGGGKVVHPGKLKSTVFEGHDLQTVDFPWRADEIIKTLPQLLSENAIFMPLSYLEGEK